MDVHSATGSCDMRSMSPDRGDGARAIVCRRQFAADADPDEATGADSMPGRQAACVVAEMAHTEFALRSHSPNGIRMHRVCHTVIMPQCSDSLLAKHADSDSEKYGLGTPNPNRSQWKDSIGRPNLGLPVIGTALGGEEHEARLTR